ncbi:MAG: acyl-CoA dehydrogenase family protein, partial [Bacteriovoracaceae bacterium]
MEFGLSQEQLEIKELALKFARNEMIPVAQEFDENGIFPKELFKKAWELGLINTCIPAEYGGA